MRASNTVDKNSLINHLGVSFQSGDLLIVHELGLGMLRGSMSNGRLSRSKYTPPERDYSFGNGKYEELSSENQTELD